MGVGKTFRAEELSFQNLAFCNQVISSDAFAALILDLLARKQGTSVVRMADGEKALIDCAQNKPLRPFLKDETWLKKYGLYDADLQKIGTDLLQAGHEAGYLAPAITGVYRPNYNVAQYFMDRQKFVDQFHLIYWHATGLFSIMLRAAPVAVIHREADKIADQLIEKFELTLPITRINVDSWKDHPAAEAEVAKADARLVLASVGPTGKSMIVRMSKTRKDQVVLDAGGAMTHTLAALHPKAFDLAAKLIKQLPD